LLGILYHYCALIAYDDQRSWPRAKEEEL